MEIRDAQPEDAEQIRAVHRESITGLGKQSYSQEQVDAWAEGCESADYESAIEAPELSFIVAECDQEVIGFGSLKFESPEGLKTSVDAEITAVYVRPTVARNGIGSSLYTALERRARNRDVEMLGLSASLNAVPFYESHEYERVRSYAHEFSSHEDTNIEGIVVEMVKELE